MIKATKEEMKQLDKWYTKDEVVESIINQLPLNVNDFDSVVDLCAGNGAWRKYCSKMYDIHPEAEDIIKQDMFDWKGEDENTLVIGNFAYGKAASLTVKMLNHTAKYCNDIVTIGPMTMTKYSRQKRVDKELKLIWEMKLPKNSFLLGGKSVDVPSVVQYWSKNGECIKVDELPNTHTDFNISNRYNPKATFVIRGVRPVVSNEVDVYERIGPTSRYYSIEPLVDGVEDRFRSIDLVAQCSSAGMPSLSIREVIKAYEDKKI